MVVILGSASKSQRDRGRDRRRSGDGRGGSGIESSCLSTISRSVNEVQLSKSAQTPVSVHGQVLGEKRKNCARVAGGSESDIPYCESVPMVKNFSFSTVLM